ncbi:FAD-binding oxidoreductase [Streptomyces sp. NBRC 109706]|uniref:FAD-binding oxidoreductase n=1 Tax=Streptomyces sp. NBRC 109706 TaxID=1550035 RepID=UPI00131AEF3F|nr:FAD-binding oxidoreductase [Streptomyces sp. NBRC 109706]
MTVNRGDPLYKDLLLRGYNRRYSTDPDNIKVVGQTSHVVQAVNEAVDSGKRLAIRGGGHCLDALVDNPEVEVVIDFTEMRDITFDTDMNAFAIQPGATLGQVYRTLAFGWGVTLPGGVCPLVGAGGHIAGNGFGALSRQHGLIADHLYAVEVVVVGADGQARAVVATRETADSDRDLWWAHTGAGGGNFGVVTRYWMRSPGASGTNPSALLPATPHALMTSQAVWRWEDLDEDGFIRVTRNFSTWLEENSAPGAPGTALHCALSAPRVERPEMMIVAQTDPSVPGNEALLDAFLADMGAGVGTAPRIVKSGQLPWLTTTINAPDSSVAQGVTGPPRWKSKVAVMRKGYSDEQIATVYQHLTRADYANPASSFSMTSYGGQINALASDASAHAHRDAAYTGAVSAAWDVVSEDDAHTKWVQQLYHDLYRDTGGVPVAGDTNDGCHVNWPDLDLLSADWNTSNTSASALFHKGNYPRLQGIKAAYDPLNVFRHPLSIELPG